MGLEVDPELEAQAQVLYDEGMELFKEGQLRPSYDKFNAATDLVPVRTKVGRILYLSDAGIIVSKHHGKSALLSQHACLIAYLHHFSCKPGMNFIV